MKKIKHVVISGNIGVGKTTLSKRISEKFNWDLELEEVKNNPYLNDFYNSMSKWSFHLQIYFLNSRFNQIQKISESKKTVIQDRSIYEDYEVFTKTLYDSGLMKRREFNSYKKLYNTILKYIKKPDLIIFLRNDNIEKIINNIKKRRRNFEREIDKNYLVELNKYYSRWIKNHNKKNIIEIDLTKNDFVKDQDFLKRVFDSIESKINDLN